MRNIKKLRAKMNMTQDELAKRCGVTRTTMIAWENTLTELTEKNAQKLLDIFNCSIYELYGMDEFKHYPKENVDKIGLILMLYNLLNENEKKNVLTLLQEAIENEQKN